jgi:hypothetical protein
MGGPPPLSATELANELDELGRPTWRVRLDKLRDDQLLRLALQLAQAETGRAAAAEEAAARVEAELALAIERRLIDASIAFEVQRWRGIMRRRAEALIAKLDGAGAALAALCAAWREWLDANWTQPVLSRVRARVQVVRAERAGAALRDWHARPDARRRESVRQLPEAELQYLHACSQGLYKLDSQALYDAAEASRPDLRDMSWAVDAARDVLPREVEFRAELARTHARVRALNDADDADGSTGADGSDGQGQTPAVDVDVDRPTGS